MQDEVILVSTRGARLPNRSGAGAAGGGLSGLSGRERVGTLSGPQPESRVQVVRTPTTDEAVRSVLGRGLSEQEIAGLVGAQPGDRVFIGGRMNNRQVGIEVVGHDYSHVGSYTVFRPNGGRPVLYANVVSVASDQRGQGLTTRILREQIRSAARIGLASIDLVAGRGEFTSDMFAQVPGITAAQAARLAGRESGYYFWPLRGFSTHLQPDDLASMPARLRSQLPAVDAQYSDLVRADGGPAWLREHGGQRGVSFDLTRGSPSRQILAAVLRQLRRQQQRGR